MDNRFKLLVALVSVPSILSAFEARIESFRDGIIPTGYVNVDDGVNPEEVINLSADPFVDYLIPTNSGSAGIIAQKSGGSYIVDSTVGELPGGANNGSSPDIYHVAFEWSDGSPLPIGSDYYGVSWGGWDANTTVNLTTRINIASSEPTLIYHWFNDGWNYANHAILDGHRLSVVHYDSSGIEVDSFTEVLTSGGAEEIFGDHRQFYTLILEVQRTGEGDFLLISQEGANVGYRGTAVSLKADSEPSGWGVVNGEWIFSETLGWTLGQPGEFGYSLTLGWLYHDGFPWFYHYPLGWFLDLQIPGQSVNEGGVYLYSPTYGNVFLNQANGGWFYSYDLDAWQSFLNPTGL